MVQLPKHRKSHDPVQKPIRNWKRTSLPPIAAVWRARPSQEEAIENGQKHLKSLAENVRALCYYLRPVQRVQFVRTWFLLDNAMHIYYYRHTRAESKIDSLIMDTSGPKVVKIGRIDEMKKTIVRYVMTSRHRIVHFGIRYYCDTPYIILYIIFGMPANYVRTKRKQYRYLLV